MEFQTTLSFHSEITRGYRSSLKRGVKFTLFLPSMLPRHYGDKPEHESQRKGILDGNATLGSTISRLERPITESMNAKIANEEPGS